MPTDMLDSPAVPLAAVFLAGQRSSGLGSRQDTGGESGVNILAGGFADASSGWLSNELFSAVGMGDTVSPLLGRALIGAGVSRVDQIPKNRAMARGIMYGIASDGVSEMGVDLGSLVGGSLGGGGTESAATPQRTRVSPQQVSGGRSRRSSGGLSF